MKHELASSIAAACIALVAGCASTSLRPGQNVYVYVTGSGNITVEGESIEMADLPARLHKMGATPETPVIFKTQGDVPPRVLHWLVGSLQSHGYTKAMFQGPRHADAFVPDAEVNGFDYRQSEETVREAPDSGGSLFPAPADARERVVRPSPRNAGASGGSRIRESPRNVGAKERR